MGSKGKSKTPLLRGLTWLFVILSALLIIASLLTMSGWLQPTVGRGLDKVLSKMAQIFAFVAVLLIVIRPIWNIARKQKIQFLHWTRSAWQFLWLRHVFFGWIVAATATAHGVYFLLLPRGNEGLVSGLLALGVMAILVICGYVLDKKSRTNKKIKMVHTVLGILFIAALLYHTSDLEGGHERGEHPRNFGGFSTELHK